jgi:hypothetical protein
MQARIEALETGCLGSARSGCVRVRLDAFEHALSLSSPEPDAALFMSEERGLVGSLPS